MLQANGSPAPNEVGRVRFRSCKEGLSAKNMQCPESKKQLPRSATHQKVEVGPVFLLVLPRTRKPDIAGDENHQLRPNIPSRQDAANSERSRSEMDARAKAKANRSKRRGDSDKVGRHSSSGMRIGSELRAIYGCG